APAGPGGRARRGAAPGGPRLRPRGAAAGAGVGGGALPLLLPRRLGLAGLGSAGPLPRPGTPAHPAPLAVPGRPPPRAGVLLAGPPVDARRRPAHVHPLDVTGQHLCPLLAARPAAPAPTRPPDRPADRGHPAGHLGGARVLPRQLHRAVRLAAPGLPSA